MIGRLVVGDQLAQHRHEHVDRVRGLAFLVRQPAPAKRVVRAVHLRAAVDEEQRRMSHSTNDIIAFDAFVAPRSSGASRRVFDRSDPPVVVVVASSARNTSTKKSSASMSTVPRGWM